VRSADNLVQKYVGELRRAFDPHRALLCSATNGYQLRLDSAQLDSLVFGRCLDHARTARSQGDLTRAERWLRDALALWRGAALDGIELDLAAQERARLHDQRASVLEDLIELRLARGEHESVADELSRLVGEYPLRERLRELQMLALYRQGRQADWRVVRTKLSLSAAVPAIATTDSQTSGWTKTSGRHPGRSGSDPAGTPRRHRRRRLRQPDTWCHEVAGQQLHQMYKSVALLIDPIW
jgi:hypothetical protein